MRKSIGKTRIVGHQQDRGAAIETLTEHSIDTLGSVTIKARSRLIEQQNLGVEEQQPDQRKPLALTGRGGSDGLSEKGGRQPEGVQ